MGQRGGKTSLKSDRLGLTEFASSALLLQYLPRPPPASRRMRPTEKAVVLVTVCVKQHVGVLQKDES